MKPIKLQRRHTITELFLCAENEADRGWCSIFLLSIFFSLARSIYLAIVFFPFIFGQITNESMSTEQHPFSKLIIQTIPMWRGKKKKHIDRKSIWHAIRIQSKNILIFFCYSRSWPCKKLYQNSFKIHQKLSNTQK